MKIAVSDACIFIDIINLNITHHFFNLPIEVHTSLEVFDELSHQQKAILSAYRITKLLHIHNLTAEEREKLLSEKYPSALSCTDKSAIFLARQIQAVIISSDKPVRHFAKDNAIDYHGMLWILDRLIENSILRPLDASGMLEKLMVGNIVYQNNFELLTEADKRQKKWSKGA